MDPVRLNEIGEDALVARLTRKLPLAPNVLAGAGDDCAVVRPRNGQRLQLLKTDCVVEGIHFLRTHPAQRVGWKALCRAISDIAACGGRPDAALITLAAPENLELPYAEGIFRGISRAARQFGVSVVGGETARSPEPVFLSVALTGWVEPKHLALRSGGRAGDAILVTGRLGGSLRGKHLTFSPRVEEACWLASRFPIHAMMDLSDGLGTDLPRLADASRKGFEIDPKAVPRNRGCSVESAVSDGEDYELLFTVAPSHLARLRQSWARKFPRLPLTRIGSLVKDVCSRTGLAAGYSHFGMTNFE